MKKTTVYLEIEVDRALDRLALSRRTSKAEVIRSVLREAAQQAQRPRIRAIAVAQGPGDVADDVDRHLAEDGFGAR